MRKLTHAISEIRFADDWSSLFCQCGEDIHGVDPDDLSERYEQHREAVGQPRRGVTEMLANSPDNEFMRRQRAGATGVRTSPVGVA